MQDPEPRTESADPRPLVRRVGLFSGLDDGAIERVADALERREFVAGEDLVREGEAGHGLFLVDSGDLEVAVLRNGSRVTIGKLGRSDFFGEMALLRDTPRTATVTASGPAVVWVLSREALERVIASEPVVFERLGAEMRRRDVANAFRSLQ